jgi:hypothetical protein
MGLISQHTASKWESGDTWSNHYLATARDIVFQRQTSDPPSFIDDRKQLSFRDELNIQIISGSQSHVLPVTDTNIDRLLSSDDITRCVRKVVLSTTNSNEEIYALRWTQQKVSSLNPNSYIDTHPGLANRSLMVLPRKALLVDVYPENNGTFIALLPSASDWNAIYLTSRYFTSATQVQDELIIAPLPLASVYALANSARTGGKSKAY